MWEWRVFWPLESKEQGPDVYKLLRSWFTHNESPRTDAYIAMTTAIGVKWRGGKTLEIKVRHAVDDATGAERWAKIYHEQVPQPSNPADIKQIIASTLKTLSCDVFKTQLEEASLKLQDSDFKLQSYAVAKQRRTGQAQGCSIEQTDLNIGGKLYRTVALETDRPGNLAGLLAGRAGPGQTLRDVLLAKGKSPCGYPEFVLQL